ncbi:MAG TPA: cytochrome c oxidase subunit 3 [Gemmatimonadales bacterium]|jgi:heme/copper-type cytochrome/quinol oxidase subunit 3
MTAATHVRPVPPLATGREPAWWGMTLLIATEAALFAYLLFSYFYVGSMARGGWPPGRPPELTLTLPNTFVLLASSVTMWWAESGIRGGNTRRLTLGLAVTIVLGAAFLAIQGVEYSHARFTPRTDAHGSLFYIVTGFHGAHVLVGLLILAFVLARALRGHFRPDRRVAVTVAGMYWHFVDLVWLAVFTSLYLAPRLA